MELSPRVSERTLQLIRSDAGIPVLVEDLPDARTSGFMVCVHTGSRDEPEGKSGISHLLEHTVFRGTDTRTSLQISEEIESAGGELNGFTSKEMTAFYSVTLDRTAHVARDLLADISTRPLLLERDVELEKSIVTQEISMWENEPDSYIHKLFAETLWSPHPLSMNEAGESEVVGSLTSADLREYFEARYRPPNMAVLACGNVSSDEAMEWVEGSFDHLPRTNPMERGPPAANGQRMRVFRREGEHSYVGLGFPTFASDHPDRDALRMLSAVLGAGMSSRLFQSVREREGLVYSIYNTTNQYTDSGLMGTFFSTSERNVARVLDLVAKEFKGLKEEGLRKGELDRAKNLVIGAMVRRMESTEARMFRLVRSYMHSRRAVTLKDELDRLAAVKEEDLLRVANAIMRPGSMALSVFGPESESYKDDVPLSLDF